MSWTRNGITQGRQAKHFQSCTYQFHGSFNPGRHYDHPTYHDTFQYPFAMNGRTGIATFYITGSFTISGKPSP